MNSENENAEFISEISKKLKRHEPPDGLWNSIEKNLTIEKKSINKKTRFLFFPNTSFWKESQIAPQLAFCLAILAVISLAVIIAVRFQSVNSEVIPFARNQNDEMQTEEYYQAIQVLQNYVDEKKSTINPHIMSVNKEKISSIDESIKSCENALKKNELNLHVKEFLNQSLSQKYATLKYLVGQIREKHNNEKS